MPSPCSPECDPLYSRTISKVSSAMARIALTSFSSFRFSTGRTCRQPSEACAYMVPLVPAKTEIGHQLAKLFQARHVFGLIFLGKLDDQDGIGIAANGGRDDRL